MAGTAHSTLGAERRKARHYGMQALYKWYMTQSPPADIEAVCKAAKRSVLLRDSAGEAPAITITDFRLAADRVRAAIA